MDCRKWVELYSTDCNLKYSSEATRKNYISCVTTFLWRFKNYREPKEIPTQEIKNWLISFNTNNRNHKLCGIKSFYEITVGMPVKLDKIPFAQKEKKLPIVLSVDEMQRMFNVCTNKKHKVILALMYSSGLRVSEVINLKWIHIDRERKVINVVAGKGKKDRQTLLPNNLIKLLEEYFWEYKPKEYVLNGQFDLQYSSTSCLQVVKQLASKAGINKRVWNHLIRHNAFTHLCESGTDINLIQRLAGHTSPKTTSIYLHISHNTISKIQSPLSNIQL
jgi:site-specific recombinase XerD